VKEYVPDGDSPYITFYYHSFDGEQGKHTQNGPRKKKKSTYELATLQEVKFAVSSTDCD